MVRLHSCTLQYATHSSYNRAKFGSAPLHEIWAECSQTPLLLPAPRMKFSCRFVPWVGSRKGPLTTLCSAPIVLLRYPTTRLTSPPQPPFSPSLLRLPRHPPPPLIRPPLPPFSANSQLDDHDSWEEHNSPVANSDPCKEELDLPLPTRWCADSMPLSHADGATKSSTKQFMRGPRAARSRS